MDMESTSRDRARDTLGDDNADILSAKRQRDGIASKSTTDAAALRARMAGASQTVSAVNRTASGASTQPVRPTAAARPTAPAVASRAASARTGQTPAGAQSRTGTAAPAQRPASRPAEAAPRVASVSSRPPERSSQKPNTVSAAKAPHPASSKKSDAVIAVIPPARPTASKTKAVSGDATRVTDISGIRMPQTDGETRLHNRAPIKQTPLIPTSEPEIEDESEGGNTIISIIKAITYIVAVVVVSVFLSIFVILVGNDIYAFVKPDTLIDVEVPEYATLNDMATLLSENGIIEYPAVFKVYASLKDDGENAGVFLAGSYSLSPMMNYDELLAAFKPKKPSGVSRITIPEGYTTDEIIDLFVSKGIGTREGYIDVINNYDFDYWFIDALEATPPSEERYYRLDGYLFPDTYEFYNASTEEVVIGKLLRRFNEVFPASYAQKAEEIGYTVDQILIIASLIEKEAGNQADFFDISSVFNNRLKNPANYPYLESDATIVYAIEHDTGEHITPTAEHIAYDSPYNTYKHRSFPPGPIANPSAGAIRAALYPSDTDYHYFVSASARLTYFASTRAEHEANIERIKNGTNTEQLEGENPGVPTE